MYVCMYAMNINNKYSPHKAMIISQSYISTLQSIYYMSILNRVSVLTNSPSHISTKEVKKGI